MPTQLWRERLAETLIEFLLASLKLPDFRFRMASAKCDDFGGVHDPLLQVAFCPFMAPVEAKLEEECFAPCEKVPSSTWSDLGGPRGEVQWGSGSP